MRGGVERARGGEGEGREGTVGRGGGEGGRGGGEGTVGRGRGRQDWGTYLDSLSIGLPQGNIIIYNIIHYIAPIGTYIPSTLQADIM